MHEFFQKHPHLSLMGPKIDRIFWAHPNDFLKVLLPLPHTNLSNQNQTLISFFWKDCHRHLYPGSTYSTLSPPTFQNHSSRKKGGAPQLVCPLDLTYKTPISHYSLPHNMPQLVPCKEPTKKIYVPQVDYYLSLSLSSRPEKIIVHEPSQVSNYLNICLGIWKGYNGWSGPAWSKIIH